MIALDELATWDAGSLQHYLMCLKDRRDEVAGAIANVELVLSVVQTETPMTWAEAFKYLAGNS